ncbi:hypothetical protein EDC01DRAFT_678155 [Geopyxis carbonaria]|nr:hypothetical protein EDC01DRAFT_678155 [Geopyxis carbonaria]
MASLATLPDDLLLMLVPYIRRSNLRNFSLTSRRMYSAASHILYSALHINSTKEYAPLLAKLTADPAFAARVTYLCDATEVDNSTADLRGFVPGAVRTNLETPPPSAATIDALRQIIQLLPNLRSLTFDEMPSATGVALARSHPQVLEALTKLSLGLREPHGYDDRPVRGIPLSLVAPWLHVPSLSLLRCDNMTDLAPEYPLNHDIKSEEFFETVPLPLPLPSRGGFSNLQHLLLRFITITEPNLRVLLAAPHSLRSFIWFNEYMDEDPLIRPGQLTSALAPQAATLRVLVVELEHPTEDIEEGERMDLDDFKALTHVYMRMWAVDDLPVSEELEYMVVDMRHRDHCGCCRDQPQHFGWMADALNEGTWPSLKAIVLSSMVWVPFFENWNAEFKEVRQELLEAAERRGVAIEYRHKSWWIPSPGFPWAWDCDYIYGVEWS